MNNKSFFIDDKKEIVLEKSKNNIYKYKEKVGKNFLEEISKRNIENSLEKLQKAKVCILGAGGLGSNIAEMLARSSVGYLHIVDFDLVEISNLNRQSYFLEDVGKIKVEALKNKIKKINPFVKVDIENTKITDNNIGRIIKDENIIVEAVDDAKTKAMIVNEILENHTTKYIISASGMAGLENSNNIKTKKINNNFYISGDGYTDFENYSGIMAPRVMICAGHQANIVLRIILEKED